MCDVRTRRRREEREREKREQASPRKKTKRRNEALNIKNNPSISVNVRASSEPALHALFSLPVGTRVSCVTVRRSHDFYVARRIRCTCVYAICTYVCTHATAGRYHFGSLGAACCRIGVTRCTYVVCKVYICKVYTRAVALRFALHLYVHMYTAVYEYTRACVRTYARTYVHVCTTICGHLVVDDIRIVRRRFLSLGVSRFVNDRLVDRSNGNGGSRRKA